MLSLTTLTAVLACLASPAATASAIIAPRQGKFCEKVSPAPPDDVIKARHDKFVEAFLVKKDINETFTYIAPEYINNNVTSPDSAQRALDFLARVWGNQNITIHRTRYKENYSWLNYAGMAGSNIIDRYRWEGGCIVQHWDRGEVWPAD
ncbi:hypothetical protein QBC34DRAFT_297666 [Podospora aff. communis PSN243]|uniref:SnoaL-like domain-containing protein n=1 Tax=Podospora aff. communis PSN243 TaxID=3040156 RepID=A0AAV9GQE0_9PEZI|nr:hypothetical protein QBC34DRAFT_297666 [Podospora aff. communis PSN243]